MIYRKNKDYLNSHPDAESSVAVKVRSNLFVTTLQIETTENEISVLENKIKKQGCGQCKK